MSYCCETSVQHQCACSKVEIYKGIRPDIHMQTCSLLKLDKECLLTSWVVVTLDVNLF
jgi:hypothetical protein